MDKKQALELAAHYKARIRELMPAATVYLFGSYSKGTFTHNSDIDIAVVVPRRSEDYFEDTPLLWRVGRQVSLLIEPVLLAENEPCPLYDEVMRTGIEV